jgi:hypothetical protein
MIVRQVWAYNHIEQTLPSMTDYITNHVAWMVSNPALLVLFYLKA